MTTRCIVRNVSFALSAVFAVVAWSGVAKAAQLEATASVLTWNSAGTGTFFIATAQYPTQAIWDSSAAAIGDTPGQFMPQGLTFLGGINLTNSDLIVQADNPTDAAAAYSFLQQAAAAGYEYGAWSGNPIYPQTYPSTGQSVGIFSDATQTSKPNGVSAATDPDFLTAIGVVPNDGNGNNIGGNDTFYATWDGQNVGVNSILVKYTWYGDTNLDGVVDPSDLTSVVNGYQGSGTGWSSGESDYAGSPFNDTTDLTNVVNSYQQEADDQNTAGYPIVDPSDPTFSFDDAQTAGQFAGALSVPEPATGVMGLLGIVGLIAGWSLRRRSVSVEQIT